MGKGKIVKGIIGVLLIVIAIVGIFLWETVGREALTYKNVIVLKQDLKEFTEITDNMLAYIKVPQDLVLENAITNPKDIVGKSTTNFIPAKTQLVSEFFQESNLVLKDNEYVLSIPDSWLASYPQTLRRADTVYFYAIKNKDDEVTYDKDGNPVVKNKQKDKIICSATVVYAKDSGSQEVYSNDEERLESTGNVNQIEIICTMNEAEKLTSYTQSGYKFVLMYN